MSGETAGEGLRERLTRQGEDALGKLAQDLLENPLISGALSHAFEAREKASAAQEAAMGALNIPSAADLERLTRRLRSVSQRLEGIEEAVDRLDQRLAGMAADEPIDARLSAIEVRLDALATSAEVDDRLKGVTAELVRLRESLAAAPEPLHREQERLQVGEPGAV
jgi:chromosome segregation ATPase